MHSFNSPPRPNPLFFTDNHSFTTKKARSSTPCNKKVPPRPPCKSVPPISRIFPPSSERKAHAISFKDTSDSSILSKHYDESRHESYFEQCFVVEKKIGCGSFGDVFKVKSKEDNKYYAVKKSRERFKGKLDRERKLQEVCRNEQLPPHPNCVRLYKAWEERGHLYMQTELCDTSLSDFAEQHHDIPERIVWDYLVDLLKATKHLHDHDLVHLDIKPDNIFIAKDGLCKLGDFGLVLDLTKHGDCEATEGDPKYLAKELMQAIFTKSADIFSLGITILELACDLDLPSGGEGWHRLRDGNIPSDLYNGMSQDLREIIQSMMHPDHDRRPSASDLLSDPRIVRYDSQRRVKLSIRRVYYSFAEFLNTVLFAFITLVTVPVIWIKDQLKPKRDLTSTPPPAKDKFFNNDESYSDDDFLDTTVISPILNSSSLNDSKSSHSFTCSSMLNNSINHSNSFFTSNHKYGSNNSLNSSENGHQSPLMFRTISPNRKRIISQKLDFCDYDDDIDYDDYDVFNKTINIGPKNLLNTFDEIDSDDNFDDSCR